MICVLAGRIFRADLATEEEPVAPEMVHRLASTPGGEAMVSHFSFLMKVRIRELMSSGFS